MRATMLPTSACALLAGVAIAAITLAGCGRTTAPVAPATEHAPASALAAGRADVDGLAEGRPTANLFYPLELGNHWSYEHALSIVIVPEGGPPGPTFGLRDGRDRDLVCIEHRAGHSYVVERVSYSGTRLSWWVRYRQDGAGLYEADVNISQPPTCAGVAGRRNFDTEAAAARQGEQAWATIAAKLADPAKQIAYRDAWGRLQARALAIRRALGADPGAIPRAGVGGGVESGEITRLQYPLHPGAHWVIRTDPRFESTVEGAEVLDLAVGRLPAWRIRLGYEGLGPADHVHFWYGRSGFLKLAAHVEEVATDQSGNPIGRVIGDESEQLVDLSLSRGRFATP